MTGIALRLVFSGKPGGLYSAMDGAFVYFVPIAVGAITIYIAETKKPRSWRYYMAAPFFANLLFVLGTLAIQIEGLICAIIIVPLFGVLAILGGLAMGAAFRVSRRLKGVAYSLGALPIVLGALAPQAADEARVRLVERSIVIAAPAPKVWQQLHDTRDIQPGEVGHAWMYRIGVPLPLMGVTEQTPAGPVRKVSMGKSIHFEQVATDWQENRYVRWTYRFTKDSIPPQALDDHVMIGGHYFDLQDTSYALTAIDANTTRLEVKMHYRVSTDFNWYADRVARLLIGNFEEVILDFYRQRAQRAAVG
jgi:hypothetical protein